MQRIGHESLEAFVKTTQNVITETLFDSVIAASDSGHLAAYITNIVYKSLGFPPPQTFIAPIFRHVDEARTIIFDNSQQAANFSEWKDYDLKKVLFTDDEILHGNTLNGLLDLLMELNIQISDLTIIAEDGGFSHGDYIRNIPLRYIPPKQRVKKVYNAFSYVVPNEYYWPVREALSDEPSINYKQVMCTLLGLPVKDRLNSAAFFSPRLLRKVAISLPDFELRQQAFSVWLSQEVQYYMHD